MIWCEVEIMSMRFKHMICRAIKQVESSLSKPRRAPGMYKLGNYPTPVPRQGGGYAASVSSK